MNQTRTAPTDIFTRLSEQAAGAADAAQPTHAPFFAPLRDIDLPPPASVTTGANQATLSPPAGQREAYPATSPLWLDPLVPPDSAWADRPVPTLGWLASTVQGDAIVPPVDDESVVAAPAMPASGSPDLVERENLWPSGGPEALTPDSAVPALALMAAAHVAAQSPSAPSTMSPDLGTKQQPDPSNKRDDDNAAISRASFAATGTEPVRDSAHQAMLSGASEGGTNVPAQRLLPGAGDTRRTSAVPDAPTEMEGFSDKGQSDGVSSVNSLSPASSDMTVEMELAARTDETVGSSVQPSETSLHAPSMPEEGLRPLANQVIHAHREVAQSPASGTSSQMEATVDTPALAPKHITTASMKTADDVPPVPLRLQSDSAQQDVRASSRESSQHRPQHPEHERRATREDARVGGPAPSTTPASDAHPVSPQYWSDLTPSVESSVGISPRTGSEQSQGERGVNYDEEMAPADVGPDLQQTFQSTPVLRPGHGAGGRSAASGVRSPEEVVAPRYAQSQQELHRTQASAEVGAVQDYTPGALSSETSTSSSPVTHSQHGVPGQEATRLLRRHDAVQDDTLLVRSAPVSDLAAAMPPGEHPHRTRDAESMQWVAPAQTSAGPRPVQHTPDAQTELSYEIAAQSLVPASAAPSVAAPRARADTMSASATLSASAPLQQRTGAMVTSPTAQPLPAAQTSIEPPAVQPRLARAAGTTSVANLPGRSVEPQTLPTVHVTIGRVEVRYAAPRPVSPPARRPSRHNLPLNTILQRDVWEVI